MLKLPKSGRDVVVRRPKMRDLEEWYEMEADPLVKQFLGGPVKKTSEEWICGMRNQLSTTDTLVIEAKEGSRFAGRAAVKRTALDGVFEIEIVLQRKCLGMGWGKQTSVLLIDGAIAELGATELRAIIHLENSFSQESFKSLNFVDSGNRTIEGHFVFTLSNGCWRDGWNSTPRQTSV